MCKFEKIIAFEKYLYGEQVDCTYEIVDIDFWVGRIYIFPMLRPFELEKCFRLCVEYCKNSEFREKLLEKCNFCIVLIHRLYKRGIYSFYEIEPFLRNEDSLILSYYFRSEISDFESFIRNKSHCFDFDESFLENLQFIDDLIEYGFHQSSLEYCLKYDDVDSFRNFNILNQTLCKWSPFEWSLKPESLDLLSFSGFFGSINCFKHLLMNGYEIDDKVRSLVVCSGSIDLFHLCNEGMFFSTECLFEACSHCQLSILNFLYENQACLNAKKEENDTPLHWSAFAGHISVIEFLINHGADINALDTTFYEYLIYQHQFTIPPKKIINVLLSISLIMEQI